MNIFDIAAFTSAALVFVSLIGLIISVGLFPESRKWPHYLTLSVFLFTCVFCITLIFKVAFE